MELPAAACHWCGSCEYTTGTLAYIGIKKGDNYADIVLNEDELRDLVGSLTHTLDFDGIAEFEQTRQHQGSRLTR
ncbi:MAG: hypothetical protein QOE74_1174 [Mycobacterium sp.]|nr:hypothetical protein [Mycobacterium sp.]